MCWDDYVAYEYGDSNSQDPRRTFGRIVGCLLVLLTGLCWSVAARGDEPFRVTLGTEAVTNPLLATVRVAVQDASTTYHGSGTILESVPGRSLVLTVAHTHRGTSPAALTTIEHGGRRYSARVQQTDAANDLALLVADTDSTLPTVSLAELVPSIDDRLRSCGRDANGTLTVQEVTLTAVDRYSAPVNLETTGSAPEGRSGGGLFNAAGRLVGVLQGRRADGVQATLYVRLPPVRVLLGLAGTGASAAATTDEIQPRSRRVLAFVTDWCGQCRPFKTRDQPWLERSGWKLDATERAHVQIVDGDRQPGLVTRYGVTSYPEFVLVEQGRVVTRTNYAGQMTVVELMLGKPETPPAPLDPRKSGSAAVPLGSAAAGVVWYWPQAVTRRRR